VWRAAWATTATQGAINWFNEPSYEDDPAFEVNWSSMPEEQRHIFPELQEAGSQLEYDSIVERDRVNRENYSIIANGGVDGIIAAFATGILDPITLPLWFVPFVGTGFKAAGAGGRIGRISGYALADVAARDTILHHSDPSRTANETYKNLLIAASVSSALGMMSMRTMARVPNTTKKTVVDEVERHAGQTADIELAGQSVGAMFVGKVKPSVALEKPVRGAKWWRHTMIQTPVLRSAFSTEVNLAAPAKRMSELVYSGITKEKHLLGIADDFAVPVDVEARTIGKINMAVNLSEIKKLRSALKKKGVLIKTEELNNLMESMVVYGDVYRIPKHLEPHRELFFPMAKRIRENRAIRLERLQKQRMLSDDVEPKFNKFYGPRLFSKKKMDELPNVWVAGVVRGYKARGSTKTVEQLEERALQAYRNAATTAKHLDAELGGIRRIPRSRKTLKGISLEIYDEFIEEFLIRDVIKAEAHLNWM